MDTTGGGKMCRVHLFTYGQVSLHTRTHTHKNTPMSQVLLHARPTLYQFSMFIRVSVTVNEHQFSFLSLMKCEKQRLMKTRWRSNLTESLFTRDLPDIFLSQNSHFIDTVWSERNKDASHHFQIRQTDTLILLFLRLVDYVGQNNILGIEDSLVFVSICLTLFLSPLLCECVLCFAVWP